MTDFSEIAKRYEKDSLVQKSASEQLFDLLQISGNDDVLDVGCGAGNLTKTVAEKTKGKVVGVDASDGMIAEAKKKFGGLGIEFAVCPVEKLSYTNNFDVIFCNSAFQWFKHTEAAMQSCFKALKAGGRMGIQAPDRNIYCPNYLSAIEKVKSDLELAGQFASFTAPWLFLDTAKEYAQLFEAADFRVQHAWIDQISSFHTPEEVFKIFDSGASAGYLNPKCYSHPISDEYVAAFRKVMLESFKSQANSEGKVNLVFYRIFLLAKKPR
jgi:ubiquinone/menaquinone biosynthesis C-methylase UbiE